MKLRIFTPSLLLLPLLALVACGGGSGGTTAAKTPATTQPQIVFEGPGVPGTVSEQELYTGNLDGSNIVQITDDGLNKFLAHFSPDGTKLVYTKFLSGHFGDLAPEDDIFTYSFATSTETRLTTTGNGFQPAWSPDGTQIAFGNYDGTALYVMNADGSDQHLVGQPSGAPDDVIWHDTAWSSDNWIFFVVKQLTNNCFKVRLDKIRPDGSSRTQVSGGGSNCTPPNMEPYGDADPGISADGQTVYSSRGLSPCLPITRRRCAIFMHIRATLTLLPRWKLISASRRIRTARLACRRVRRTGRRFLCFFFARMIRSTSASRLPTRAALRGILFLRDLGRTGIPRRSLEPSGAFFDSVQRN